MASSTGLVWKVALGVFLGGSSLLLATCGVLAVAGHALEQEQERAGKELARQLERAYSEIPLPTASINDVRNKREAANRAAARKELPPGHRCINGQTFRRVENGWVQVSSTCTP
jgi:hypothetical protein